MLPCRLVRQALIVFCDMYGATLAAVATFLEGDVEVVEFEVAPGAPADGTAVRDLGLPSSSPL